MAKVFLCHSSIDKPFVRRLAEDLCRLNLDVWVDEKEIFVGDPIREKIENGLKASDYLGIVLTPDSVRSPWVQKELDAKLIEEIETRKVTVLPLLHKDCEIPLFLAGKHYADFRSNYDAGLLEVTARLRRTDPESDVKRRAIQRLATVDASKIEPHALIQLTFASKQFELAEELIDAHEKGHPSCGMVFGTRTLIKLNKFSSQPSPETFADALHFAVELCLRQPNQQHLQNVRQLTEKPVVDPKTLVKLLSLADEISARASADASPITVGLVSCVLFAAHRQQRTPADNEKIIRLAISLIEGQTSESLLQAMGRLVHLVSHLLHEANAAESSKHLARLLHVSASKVVDAQESADAFLHLAWCAAKLNQGDEAKRWLSKYKFAVPAVKYRDSIAKHSPLNIY